MTVTRTKPKIKLSDQALSVEYVTNKIDYSFIELFEGDYKVIDLDRSDIILLARVMGISADELFT